MGVQGKIVEIFKSIQGEGKYVGLPQIFLRLGFCNLQCTYCDTDFISGKWMGQAEVLEEIRRLLEANQDVQSISVTGGEPLLQDEFLLGILPELKSSNLRIFLETNGTLPTHLSKVLSWIDVVSMDMKLSSASLTPDFWPQHRQFLASSTAKDAYVKVVLSEQTTEEDFQEAVNTVAQVDPRTCFILQPVTALGAAKVPKAAQIEKWTDRARRSLRDVRLIPQMHRVWGIA